MQIKPEEMGSLEVHKSLEVLTQIDKTLLATNLNFEEKLAQSVGIIPGGFSNIVGISARIELGEKEFLSANFALSSNVYSVAISPEKVELDFIDEVLPASINLYFVEANDLMRLSENDKSFISLLADRFSVAYSLHRLNKQLEEWREFKYVSDEAPKSEWSVILEMLKKTDQSIYSIVSRKMLNYMFYRGLKEAKELFIRLGTNPDDPGFTDTEVNTASKKTIILNAYKLGYEIFTVASNYFTDSELVALISKWTHEEKSLFLVKILANPSAPLTEIADALRRYHFINPEQTEVSSSTHHGIRVALVRRLLTDQLEYIEIAKNYFEVLDFYDLLQYSIFPSESQGKLGGKSAGMILAKKILDQNVQYKKLFANIKTPKTWYITSDGLMSFVYYNNLEDVVEQKYKAIDEIRKEYHHIIQAFKNSQFPPELRNGLSRALDDFGDSPIIVRSSSLLEDRLGSAFAGKYKSLFLANQGPKQERLEALMDSIAEVYASTFGPDPIGYRAERQLLDFNEEMGVMIQEVVGSRVGKYFLPAFAGVAFSNNEFRWSPRIKRDDGLIRIVPGLGTRAVDRIGNDYPVLIAPGQPDLKINFTYEDVTKHSTRYVDAINMLTNTFDTVEIKDLMNEAGNDYPLLNDVFSIVEENHIKTPVGLGIDARKHRVVTTFDNLIKRSDYIKQLRIALNVLGERLQTPVDLEFACDGKNLYILQCRPQSSANEGGVSAHIPRNVPKERVLFTANKYVTNGKVPDIAYVVNVDPDAYSACSSYEDLKDVGEAVGKLNKLLPRKTFILIGPGRWGSRDDIRLGVKVTYSDISNTAVLIEVAKKKGSYVPDLSFGTHFFQDLVESGIRYLPLYPDDADVIFNDEFINASENVLERFLPEYKHIANILKVINIREASGGNVLKVLMNADEDYAMGLLASPASIQEESMHVASSTPMLAISDEALQWRRRMAEGLAANLDGKVFGVKEIYLYGTVHGGGATSNSDIDMIAVFEGDEKQKKDLKLWLDGWNKSLGLINYNRSGYRLEKFLDVKILTTQDIREQLYYSEAIDPANSLSRKLPLKEIE